MTADRVDFDTVSREELPRLTRTAYVIVRDEGVAVEIAQEALARLYARWDRIGGYDEPGAWARLVTVRLALRARKGRRRLVSDTAVPMGVSTDPELSGDNPVWAAVAQLAPMQRAVVALRYLDDLTMDEIGAALGCAPSTARVHLHRATQRLRELMKEEVGADD